MCKVCVCVCVCVCERVERLTENLLSVRVSPGSLCSVSRGKGVNSDHISLASNVYFFVYFYFVFSHMNLCWQISIILSWSKHICLFEFCHVVPPKLNIQFLLSSIFLNPHRNTRSVLQHRLDLFILHVDTYWAPGQSCLYCTAQLKACLRVFCLSFWVDSETYSLLHNPGLKFMFNSVSLKTTPTATNS